MALSDLRLGLLAFARGLDGTELSGTLVLLPSGDPTKPFLPGGTKPFAGTELSLQVVATGGTDAIASTGSPGGGTIVPADLSQALAIFQQLAARFSPQDTSSGGSPPTSARILKPLPASYVAKLPPGSARVASATSPDAFACALRDRQPPFPPPPPPARPIAWGEVISFALRNPVLARTLGLIRDFTIAVNAADFADAGGWLFVKPSGIDDGTGIAGASPDQVKSYAALIPPLSAPRSLFSALLFPVSNPKAPVTPDQEQLDRAFAEAQAYMEGFAHIVHVRQPDSTESANETGASAVAPGSDSGIQIGWDDEQVSEWHNRQLAVLLGPVAGGKAPLESPLGVLGYRIDVREPVPGEPPGSNSGWSSLMTAAGGVPAGFEGKLPPFAGELVVEPAPSAIFGAAEYWLPLYFAQWQGNRLGLRDDTARLLAGGIAAGITPPPSPTNLAATGTPPRLTYGTTYQFRVRLADLTMQGPDVAGAPADEAVTQRAQIVFARHVPPKALGIATTPASPVTPPAQPLRLGSVALTRPRMAYPEVLFTPRYGATDDLAASARTALLAQLGLDASGTPSPVPPPDNPQLASGLPDPDVVRLAVRVEARVLAGDTADDVSGDGQFVTLYTTSRAVPPLSPLPATPPGVQLPPAQVAADVPVPPLGFAYADVAEISDGAWHAGGDSGPLPLPRSRDVRITFTPIADGPPGYFGSFPDPARTPPTIGLTGKVLTRAPALAENDLFAPPLDGSPALQAFAFRPVETGDVTAGVMQRLADQLGLIADGLTLRARPGERVIFGCSGALKHQITPDGARITFAATAELLVKWTLAYQAVLQRDWTWDGVTGRTLTAFTQDAGNPVVLGTIALPGVVSADAFGGTPDRTRTRIVFIHAIDPTAPSTVDGVTPRPPVWLRAIVAGEAGDLQIDSTPLAVRLPLVVPPAEVPDVVSAGYALAPFAIGAGYTSTAPRARRLWIEFAAPPPDGLAIVARVLAYAPDPLLYHDESFMTAPPPDDPALPIDPETMRVIVPGQLPDENGAEAMQPLIPSLDSPRRFLLPLPTSDENMPELFGLWTYEFRFARVTAAMVKLGYKGPVKWSTAHGRFGRPLRLAGVQHPAPALPAAAQWEQAIETQPPLLLANAPYATPVRDGQIIGDGVPRTTIAFALYAQVPQADGTTFRNIEVAHAGAFTIQEQPGSVAFGEFARDAVISALDTLHLPRDAGLSVIAVEFLPPGGSLEPRDAGRQRGVGQDPLGPDLFARRRILRTSPLVPVGAVCGILEPASAPGH
jgi:hypothetical protein